MSNYAITATKHYSQAKGSARLLQMMIADALNDNTDVAIRDAKLLAEECYTAVQVVRRLIMRQIAAGELIGVMANTGGGKWYQFAIPIYPGEEGYDPQPCEGADHVCNGMHTPLSISRERLYRDKAREARKHHQPARMRRARQVVNTVDNSEAYPQAGTGEFQARGTGEFHTGTGEFHTGTGEFHTGTGEFHPPDPPIRIPISDPGFYPEIDPGPSRGIKKVSRRDLEHADFLRETAELKARRKGDTR